MGPVHVCQEMLSQGITSFWTSLLACYMSVRHIAMQLKRQLEEDGSQEGFYTDESNVRRSVRQQRNASKQNALSCIGTPMHRTLTDNRQCMIMFWAEPEHAPLLRQFTAAVNFVVRLHRGNGPHQKNKAAFTRKIYTYVLPRGRGVVRILRLEPNALHIIFAV